MRRNCAILSGGCGIPTDMIHAPNENISLEEFKRGAQHIARVLCAVREVN